MSTKAIYNKDDKGLRAVCRGRYWYTQRHDNTQGTREHDPWYDCGPAHDQPPIWR